MASKATGDDTTVEAVQPHATANDAGGTTLVQIGDVFRTSDPIVARNPDFFASRDTPTRERSHWRDAIRR